MDTAEKLKGQVFMRLADHSVIYLDGKGGFRQRFPIPEGCDIQHREKWWRLRRCCKREWCGYHLSRKHFTFRHCRARRIAEGTHPADFAVDLQIFTTSKDPARKFPWVKNWLIKRLKSVIEWLGD